MSCIERISTKKTAFATDFGCGWSVLPLLARLGARADCETASPDTVDAPIDRDRRQPEHALIRAV